MSDPTIGDQPRYDRFLRSFVGLIFAPVAGPAIAMAGYAFAALVHSFVVNRMPPNAWAAFLRLVVTGIDAGVRIGVLPMLTLGWLMHLLLLRTGYIHLATYIMFSAALSVATGQLLIPFIYTQALMSPVAPFETALLAAAAGGVGGAIFWLIRRPDRDQLS